MLSEICPFILYRTCRVKRLCQFVALLEVRAVSGFISKAPCNYRRMVTVSLHHSLHALEVCGKVCLISCKRRIVITHTMRLDVSLVHDIYSITVAERVPQRVIWIVGCTHCIDIELLHHLDILNHILLCNHISSMRIHFMSVSTLYEYRLTIHKKLTVLDTHVSESDLD